MTDEKWAEIKNLIERKFPIIDHEIMELDPGKSEAFIFEGEAGKIKLERIRKPKFIENEAGYNKKSGRGSSAEEKRYSQDEFVDYIKAYNWDADMDQWSEMSIESLI